MKSCLSAITVLLVTAVSSQAYGSGIEGSGPAVTSCPIQFAITAFSASCVHIGTGCS